ncbi:MAG TPA: globin domain-containing protein [Streptosporangiaceae bacterium]|nr:globin domain-containing protein [Streptosporangiaceae bacterium]
MARRLEPSLPGSDIGVREEIRVLPALDLSAPAIIGVEAPPEREPAFQPSARPPAAVARPAADHERTSAPAASPAADAGVWRRTGAPAASAAADAGVWRRTGAPAASPAPEPGVQQRRQADCRGNVSGANSAVDVNLLDRVRHGLIDLPEQATEPTGTTGTNRAAGATVAAGGDVSFDAMRDTFALVSAAGDATAGYFYGWLFTAHPELRDLFPPAMDEHRDRLFAALTRIVNSASTSAQMEGYLAQLGRDHRKYGVSSDMYEAMESALTATLRAFAGPAFTPAAERAWAATYKRASGTMIRAAEESSVSAPAFWTAKVVAHQRRGRDIAVLTVAPDQPLAFLAGQHVTVQTRRWPKVWRPFSIAGRPRGDGLICFHVRAVPGGWVSTALVEHTTVGDDLILGPAAGKMTLPAAGTRDLLCIAGGTGLAPVKAIIEQVVSDDSGQRDHRKIQLYLGARKESDLYDLQDLTQLSNSYPWLQVHPVISDDPAFPGLRGTVSRVAAERMPHADCESYVAGPAGMVRETVDLLGSAGVPGERIHFDAGLLTPRRRVGSGT